MPRLPPSLFWRARREISPMAAQLLPACRDLQSTANELRWIREHVRSTKSPVPNGLRVWDLVCKRGKGLPLQYVLGTQPFGDLEIKCRPGVLIPRPETESYTLHLATLIAADYPHPPSVSILDLCTGTGCIPLLLLHTLQQSLPSPTPPIHLHGIDISPTAIRLARANHHHNTTTLQNLPPPDSPSTPYTLAFSQHDIFSPSLIPHLESTSDLFNQSHPPSDQEHIEKKELDLLISNPPYISTQDFSRSTARAVRNHEPKLALVPSSQPVTTTTGTTTTNDDTNTRNGHGGYECQPQDIFYARLLDLTKQLRPKRVLMEVGGMEQAVRVVHMVHLYQLKSGSNSAEEGDEAGVRSLEGYGIVEIWRDEPSAGDKGERIEVQGREVVVRGEGRGRAVYLSRVAT